MAGSDKKLYKQLSNPDSGEVSANRKALSPCTTFVGSPCSPVTPTGVPVYLVRQPSGCSTSGLGETPQLCDTVSNKTLFYLRSTLTASFQPDYVFTDARSDEFSRVPSVKWVMDAVHSNLSAIAGDLFTTLESALWEAIDEEIVLSDCDTYRSYLVHIMCKINHLVLLLGKALRKACTKYPQATGIAKRSLESLLFFVLLSLLKLLLRHYNSDFSDSYGEEGALWSFNYFFYNKKLRRIVFFTCQALSQTVEREDATEDMDDFMDMMELDPTNGSAYDSSTTGNPGWQLPVELKTS